ncbi:acyl-CoA thioesterase [Consotaella salsifontis]|uniref:Acyl-CoA thioesterase 2 n=1 Tax=Consotaella salsifontis TaxID=1365950 RepID=A0A1T4SCL4_9HYPH|nr:acyl-CoA thioesterase II [Consotaella salsifontis]SKA25973.1 (3S)-malyl-CoA thioesterase [Consotaella salsifontis]
MDQAVEKLLRTLDLEAIEEDLFRGISPDQSWQRVFGGQVIAQALVAAQRTMTPERPVHSLHCYFMWPGDPAVPIIYQVKRLRDGGSFSTRHVEAIQHGRIIFTLLASFQQVEEGLEHQIEMPDVPGPEALPPMSELSEAVLADAPEAIRRYWARPRPVEFRPVSLDQYQRWGKLPPIQHMWVRLIVPLEECRHLHAAILAFISDMTLLDTALFAHGLSVFDPRLQTASLDHAMWFHHPAMVDEWMLYTQDSPVSTGGRGLARGSLFTRDGKLVASMAQEGLIRPRRNQSA